MNSFISSFSETQNTGILLLSHGDLAASLYNTAKMIVGDSIVDFAYLGLEPDDDPNDYQNELSNLLDQLPTNTIVLIDLYGGTPCNRFIIEQHKRNYSHRGISGMNLPMILETITARENNNINDLVELVVKVGQSSSFDVVGKILNK